jgi:choline dehydrogenase-like flavoprotein
MTRQHLIQPGPLARPVRTAPALADPPPRAADIVIVGSGMAGSTLAYALRDRGARVLVLERSDFLPQEPQNWDPQAVFWDKRYKPAEEWHAGDGTAYQPGVYYWVGGNTKMFGAALTRFRAEDFGELVAYNLHEDVGVEPCRCVRKASGCSATMLCSASTRRKETCRLRIAWGVASRHWQASRPHALLYGC